MSSSSHNHAVILTLLSSPQQYYPQHRQTFILVCSYCFHSCVFYISMLTILLLRPHSLLRPMSLPHSHISLLPKDGEKFHPVPTRGKRVHCNGWKCTVCELYWWFCESVHWFYLLVQQSQLPFQAVISSVTLFSVLCQVPEIDWGATVLPSSIL